MREESSEPTWAVQKESASKWEEEKEGRRRGRRKRRKGEKEEEEERSIKSSGLCQK